MNKNANVNSASQHPSEMNRPDIKYALNSAGLNIAYWTYGDGPPDILWVPNFTGNGDAFWMFEPMARFLRRLASIGRLTQFDCSGTGGSDPIDPNQIPTMEQWMDDVRVVMDAEGIEKATLFAQDSGGPVAALFAATHPDRTAGLILCNSFARLERAPDYPFGYPAEAREKAIEVWLKLWGTGNQLAITGPEVAGDEQFREWFAFVERSSGPPRMRRPIFEMLARVDVREVLPAVRVPSLVIHRKEDQWIRVEHGRYLAEHLPHTRYVELPGDAHHPFLGNYEPLLAEAREFVTGFRDEPVEEDRVLATVLFTDIVDSTQHAANLGDRRWHQLLDRHDEIVRDAIGRFRGREVKTTGDGFLATFDGPARAVKCARAILDMARSIGVDVRAGLHCGEIEIRGEDVGGLSVSVGARVSALATGGEVLVSQTVKDLTIGSGLIFKERGKHALKGVPGEWQVYSLDQGNSN